MKVRDLRVGLVMYYVGAHHLHAVLISPNGDKEFLRLASWEALFPQVNRFMDMLGGVASRARKIQIFEEFSRGWGKHILPPHAFLQACDVLVVIPDHLLNMLPLHAIWVDEQQQFLGLSHGIVYCSSGTLFKRCVDRNPLRAADLNDWEFPLDEGSPVKAPRPPEYCITAAVDVTGDLTEQYQNVARLFSSHFSQAIEPWGDRASVKNFMWQKDKRMWEAICLVCHGYIDRAMPDDSGLLLNRQPWGIAERPITHFGGRSYFYRDLPFRYTPVEVGIHPHIEAELMTIAEMKVDCYSEAELIALLGCSTGTSGLFIEDGFQSMAYAWLKAGAVSTLASQWELDIEFISSWLPLFLNNWLTRRQPKAIAWRQAMGEILQSKPDLEPYEWSVIALFGDWL
jgi:CHAT domain-containing protein